MKYFEKLGLAKIFKIILNYQIIVESSKILMSTSYITLMATRRISLKNKYHAFLIIHTFRLLTFLCVYSKANQMSTVVSYETSKGRECYLTEIKVLKCTLRYLNNWCCIKLWNFLLGFTKSICKYKNIYELFLWLEYALAFSNSYRK